jgi:hypothetical protein
MIPMIQQAVTMGYTAAQILKYIASKFKTAAPGISSAKQQGYSDEDILKFLGNAEKANQQLTAQEQYLKASGVKSKEERKETRDKFLSGALGVAGTAVGAYNMYQNYGGMMNMLGQTFGQGGTAPQPGTPPQAPTAPQAPAMPQGQAPAAPQVSPPPGPVTPGPNMGQQIQQQATQPVQNAMQPPNQGQLAQASQAIPQQPQQPQQPPIPIFEQLTSGVDLTQLEPEKQKQLQFLSMISDELQAKGKGINDPEFKNLAKRVKDTLKGKPGVLVEESARQMPMAQQAPTNPLVPEQKASVSITEAHPIEEAKSVSKGDTVITDSGDIAEVKGVSGNNFLIEENGKVRQVPMESLRSQPKAIKNAKIVFDPSKVPEEDRSAALAISIPMPDRSAIVNMFHDGSFYVYKRKDGQPLDESIIKRIIDGQDIPISTGETYMGAWNNEKGDSRGSASFKELVSMAQDASKPDDPSKPLVFEKITNSFTHGYHKEFLRLLKEAGRQFSAKPKKPKK